MDDDEQEIIVTNTAVNMLPISDPTNSAVSDATHSAERAAEKNAFAGNAEFEDLAILFRNHHKAIFRVAYRITGSPSDAEDVLQNIFLRLAPNRRELSPNPEGYLHRAAVNASLDLLRSRARRNSVSLDVIDFEPSAMHSAASPANDLEDAELREMIRQAITKLEGRAATAFALRYFEGYENHRIAQILGTSQMVVAVTLHRARTRLRKEIGSYLEKNYET